MISTLLEKIYKDADDLKHNRSTTEHSCVHQSTSVHVADPFPTIWEGICKDLSSLSTTETSQKLLAIDWPLVQNIRLHLLLSLPLHLDCILALLRISLVSQKLGIHLNPRSRKCSSFTAIHVSTNTSNIWCSTGFAARPGKLETLGDRPFRYFKFHMCV